MLACRALEKLHAYGFRRPGDLQHYQHRNWELAAVEKVIDWSRPQWTE